MMGGWSWPKRSMAAVALLEGDEGPGHVVVDEVVAGVVEVRPSLAASVPRSRRILPLRLLKSWTRAYCSWSGWPPWKMATGAADHFLSSALVGGGLGEAVALGELVLEEAQGVDPLGEQHHPLAGGAVSVAEAVEEGEETLELGLLGGGHLLDEGEELPQQGEVVGDVVVGVALRQLVDPALQGLLAGGRGRRARP